MVKLRHPNVVRTRTHASTHAHTQTIKSYLTQWDSHDIISTILSMQRQSMLLSQSGSRVLRALHAPMWRIISVHMYLHAHYRHTNISYTHTLLEADVSVDTRLFGPLRMHRHMTTPKACTSFDPKVMFYGLWSPDGNTGSNITSGSHSLAPLL